MNSWKTKWHDSCRARYTVIFGDKIKELIVLNEDYGKVPEPSLSEVQEVQSASFFSFREILNY